MLSEEDGDRLDESYAMIECRGYPCSCMVRGIVVEGCIVWEVDL
jgi:hypothetical protein